MSLRIQSHLRHIMACWSLNLLHYFNNFSPITVRHFVATFSRFSVDLVRQAQSITWRDVFSMKIFDVLRNRLVLAAWFIAFCFFSLAVNAEAQSPRNTDLAVKISAPAEGCARGAVCRIRVAVENTGRNVYSGPIRLQQVAGPRGTRLANTSSRRWQCRYSGVTGVCSRATRLLNPGEAIGYSVDLTVPANARGRGLFCSKLAWGGRGGSERERARAMQSELARRGYRIDSIDGIVGPQTRAAIAQFQLRNRLRVTGLPDRRTVRALLGNRQLRGVRDRNPRNDEDCLRFKLIDAPRPVPTTPVPSVEAPAAPEPPKQQTGDLPIPNAPSSKPETDAAESGDDRNSPPDTVETPPVSRATCGENQFEQDGECLCNRGYTENADGTCTKTADTQDEPKKEADAPAKPTVPEVKAEPKTEKPALKSTNEEVTAGSCPGRQILGKDGKCGCYLDLKNEDGTCLVKLRKDCLPGQIVNARGKCECPKGERISGGKCTEY